MVLNKHTKYHGEDITCLKIYWDTEKKQFRHKFSCDVCGEPYECMCFDSIGDAVESVEAGFMCWYHWILDHWKDEDYYMEQVARTLDRVKPDLKFGEKFQEMLRIRDGIDDLDYGESSARDTAEKMEISAELIEDELEKIILGLPKSDIVKIDLDIDCDDLTGSFCEV